MRVLLSTETIAQRVAELAARIAADHPDELPVFLGVLKGAAPFLVDLIRCLPEARRAEAVYDFVDAKSYTGTTSRGVVELCSAGQIVLTARPVLVVDAIVDSGLTLKTVLDWVQGQGPASVRVCALLDKSSRRTCPVPVDYRGFVIEDFFVVGYGLDRDQRYRALPHVAVLR